ncbi:hypothetical protein CSC70_04850 [Pseudoxanthomonas kalamensis DSM 18571]|uniref:hypothetical protein n=1 Tax=Pseudoxanthomonas kalamensis TaxID=289483 RepID=UPI0013920024|nr:hypothetical protein [Pseudoxanthomonas kalamensis]KAF1711247.1 hypothetical protein CSC70_04850 [Pseudoxanthomonas kalamensis DSM 18571]
MKTKLLLALLLFGSLLACGKQATPEADVSPAKVADVGSDGAARPQSGDYSDLFSLAEGACPFLSTEEVAAALSIPAGNVEADGCRYVINLVDGSKSPLLFRTGEMARAEVRRAIDDMRKDQTGLLSAVPDATGDNVLAMHKPRGWLFIYNPDYDRYFRLSFDTLVFGAANKRVTVTDRKTAGENAQKVANALIAKYRK